MVQLAAALGEDVPHQARVVVRQARVRRPDGVKGCPEVAVETAMTVDKALELHHDPPTSPFLEHSNWQLPRTRLIRQRRGWEPVQKLSHQARLLSHQAACKAVPCRLIRDNLRKTTLHQRKILRAARLAHMAAV